MNLIRRFVTKHEMIETVNATSKRNSHTLYLINFERATPKCFCCGKKRKWVRETDELCSCGGQIEYDKLVRATIHSIGDDNFMYFEHYMDGVKIRCCLTDNVKSIKFIRENEMIELIPVKY